VFMVQGSVIGVLGTVLGVIGGVILAINVEPVVGAIERTFGVSFMDKNVYLINYLPSEVHSADVLSIALISLVLSFLATVYPSWRASKVNPAEALRYE
jgi:lipoprotein-releasing system permease protein